MSKTFKSTMPDNRGLEVGTFFGAPRLLIKESNNGNSGFVFDSSDAPALALAILEAAGYSEEYEGGNCWAGPLGQAMHMLRLETEAQERATAEAREQAKLEAEALELLNAEREEFSCTPVRDLSEVPARNQRAAIAVARRVREMRAEK